jgi:hypothetical protein
MLTVPVPVKVKPVAVLASHPAVPVRVQVLPPKAIVLVDVPLVLTLAVDTEYPLLSNVPLPKFTKLEVVRASNSLTVPALEQKTTILVDQVLPAFVMV